MGTAILIVEQNAHLALSFAQSAYLLQQGRVVLSGSAQEVSASPEMKASYLGEAKSGKVAP
jgi:branched-chain amino acid transport system ATP-binding protein